METQGTLVDRLVSFEVFLPFCLTNVCAPVTVRVCFACLPGPTLPPNISFSEFQAFRLRSFLELRHGGCSVWLAHGSSLLMVFGSLAPLWCLASVPSEHACLAHLPSEADGSCASVLAERTHCVGPLDVWSVLASVFPSMRAWRICL